MKVRLRWRRDVLWIGAYWDTDSRVLFICPFPMVVVVVEFR